VVGGKSLWFWPLSFHSQVPTQLQPQQVTLLLLIDVKIGFFSVL
jgi:hypothetical protein